MDSITPLSSIRRAPGSFTPRLRNRHLKKPPSPIDWVEQSYIELIQDVSLITMNYYETRINQHAALNHSADNISYHDDETLSILQSLHDEIEALGCQSLKLSSSEDETNEEENDDDDNDDDSCTETTASSIYDIRSNLYQYYRDRVRHTPEIDENTDLTEEPISTMSGPYASSITTESAGYISPDDVSIITTDVGSNDTVQEIHRKQSNYPKQYFPTQRKKKIFARMIERMRLAAEKPFWSIESHF